MMTDEQKQQQAAFQIGRSAPGNQFAERKCVERIGDRSTTFPRFILYVELPELFSDCSWGNDVCPSFINELLDCKLFINYANADDRESPDDELFFLHDERGELDSFSSNSMNEIKTHIADHYESRDPNQFRR